MTQTVVSVGCTRLFAGIGLGAGSAVMLLIGVAVLELRFTNPASGSVPVFTDQRSTPHCPNAVEAIAIRTKATATSGRILSERLFMALLYFGCGLQNLNMMFITRTEGKVSGSVNI